MKAGRELNLRQIDALVAEKVMGWGDNPWQPFFPSTDIAHAWQVLERLKDKGYIFGIGIDEDGKYVCTIFFDGAGWFEETAETVQLAICLSALKAVGYEGEVEAK